VRHPDHAGAWLAGVECDGARYHSSATARDRDRVRQAVLEGLGWKILRIWSTEWFRAPQATLEGVDRQLHELLEKDRSRREEEERSQASAGEDAAEIADPSTDTDAELKDGSQTTLASDLQEPELSDPIADADLTSREEITPNFHGNQLHFAHETAPSNGDSQFDSATLSALDPERFFEDDYEPVLLQRMTQILSEQAPMTTNNFAKQISQDHGWQRTGARIRARVDAILPAFFLTDESGTSFVWSASGPSDRVPFRGMAGRSARDISVHEIASLLDQSGAAISQSEDPPLELARQMGIARLSKDARAYLEHCIKLHGKVL
jgi:hypothetical protein